MAPGTHALVSWWVANARPLSRGLAKEVALWKGGEDPLLYLERRAYLNAIQDALAGLEAARVVLAKALTRSADGRTQNAERKAEDCA